MVCPCRESDERRWLSAAEKPCRSRQGLWNSGWLNLNVEGGPAAASALYVRVVELKARALERFDIIDTDSLQVHQRGRVNVDLQSLEVERLVHHSGAVLERDGVREPGATSADHAHAQACRYRVLLCHNLFYLGDGRVREIQGLAVNSGCRGGGYGGGCGCHSFFSSETNGIITNCSRYYAPSSAVSSVARPWYRTGQSPAIWMPPECFESQDCASYPMNQFV